MLSCWNNPFIGYEPKFDGLIKATNLRVMNPNQVNLDDYFGDDYRRQVQAGAPLALYTRVDASSSSIPQPEGAPPLPVVQLPLVPGTPPATPQPVSPRMLFIGTPTVASQDWELELYMASMYSSGSPPGPPSHPSDLTGHSGSPEREIQILEARNSYIYNEARIELEKQSQQYHELAKNFQMETSQQSANRIIESEQKFHYEYETAISTMRATEQNLFTNREQALHREYHEAVEQSRKDLLREATAHLQLEEKNCCGTVRSAEEELEQSQRFALKHYEQEKEENQSAWALRSELIEVRRAEHHYVQTIQDYTERDARFRIEMATAHQHYTTLRSRNEILEQQLKSSLDAAKGILDENQTGASFRNAQRAIDESLIEQLKASEANLKTELSQSQREAHLASKKVLICGECSGLREELDQMKERLDEMREKLAKQKKFERKLKDELEEVELEELELELGRLTAWVA